MIVLHPSLGAEALDFWGEKEFVSAGGPAARPRGRQPKNPRPARHPFEAGAEALESALRAAGVGGVWRPEDRIAWLPSAGGRPVASSPLIAGPPDSQRADADLAAWTVTAYRLSIAEAVELLCACVQNRTIAPGLVIGDDLAFAATAMRTAGSLVARERFLPGLEEKDGAFRAVWGDPSWTPRIPRRDTAARPIRGSRDSRSERPRFAFLACLLASLISVRIGFMKTVDRRFVGAAVRAKRPGEPHRPPRLEMGDRSFEIPLSRALRKERLPTGPSVALVEVSEKRLKVQFLRPPGDDLETPILTSVEEDLLTRGGVAPISSADVRVVEAGMAAEYQRLRDTSLNVAEAARRLRVNASRVRQRLAEGSLYGVKDGNTWLLPEFQFTREGRVPGIGAVLKNLPSDISPIAVARWFKTPNADLCTRDDQERPRTPLRWLLSGGSPEAAAKLAADL